MLLFFVTLLVLAILILVARFARFPSSVPDNVGATSSTEVSDKSIFVVPENTLGIFGVFSAFVLGLGAFVLRKKKN